MKLSALFPALAVLLGACSGAGDGSAGSNAGNCAGEGITVTQAWMRPTRAGQPTSAAYLTICNGSDSNIALTGASFTGAGATELHISNMSDDSIVSMSHATALSISAGTSLSLEPGRAHIMLIGLKDTYADGDAPKLTLEFSNTPPVITHLTVRDDAP